jgi:hypothetical protein
MKHNYLKTEKNIKSRLARPDNLPTAAIASL